MSCTINTYTMACVFQNNLLAADEYVFEFDITDYEFELDFKSSFNAKTAFSFSTANGGFTITDAVNGKVVRNAKQITVVPGTYYADLTITSLGGMPETVIRQLLTVLNTYQI